MGGSSDTELEKQGKSLQEWIEKITKNRETLLQSLIYFESQ